MVFSLFLLLLVFVQPVVGKETQTAGELVTQAWENETNGKYDQAISLYEEIYRKFPKTYLKEVSGRDVLSKLGPYSLQNLGQLYQKRGAYQKALDVLEKLKREFPKETFEDVMSGTILYSEAIKGDIEVARCFVKRPNQAGVRQAGELKKLLTLALSKKDKKRLFDVAFCEFWSGECDGDGMGKSSPAAIIPEIITAIPKMNIDKPIVKDKFRDIPNAYHLEFESSEDSSSIRRFIFSKEQDKKWHWTGYCVGRKW